MDYNFARSYFWPKSDSGGILVGIAGGFIILFVLTSFGSGWTVSTTIMRIIFLALGVGVVALGVWLYKRAQAKRIPDSAFDMWLAEQLVNTRNAAAERITLDQSNLADIEPLWVNGYNYDLATIKKTGKDGRVRANVVETMVVYFSTDMLHSYKRVFSLTGPDMDVETVDEVFYKDVVSLATGSGTAKNGAQVMTFDTFTITTSGGTQISCSLTDKEAAAPTITAARQIVQAKKRESN